MRVGLAIQNKTFQVLDMDLPYSLLLGRPWIHAMRVFSSTYHQCLKFPYNGTKVTISSNPDPFQYCSNLKGTTEHQVPLNWEASSFASSHYIDPSSLAKSSIPSTTTSKPNIHIHDTRCAEYTIASLFCIAKFLASPKYYGKPHPIKKEPMIFIRNHPTTFTKLGEINKDNIGEDISTWIYKNEEETKSKNILVEQYLKGFKSMKQQGYDRHCGLGLNKHGMKKPLFPPNFPKNIGLGYVAPKVIPPCTKLSLGENVNASNKIETSE